ncbi:MAG: hypothetical protein N4A74_19065 [Carboxylicivirga sp.]|jgi:hypothetical protein|nr:hypothetical protein [Carboxylicivirga sp.]
MKNILSIIFLITFYNINLSAQNWEIGTTIRNLSIKGTDLYTNDYPDGASTPGYYEISKIAANGYFGTVNGGLYIPIIKMKEAMSIGIQSELMIGITFMSENMGGTSMFASLPVNIFYRFGAGSIKRSRNALGFGVGFGVEYFALGSSLEFNNIVGYDKAYLSPNLCVEMTLDNFFRNKTRFQYRTSVVRKEDNYFNSRYDIEYGVNLMSHTVAMIYVIDFK